MNLFRRLMAKPQPLRCALLNTGELILVDGQGATQVLSEQTTDLIRDVLAASECSTPLPVACTAPAPMPVPIIWPPAPAPTTPFGEEGPAPGGRLFNLTRGPHGEPA